MYYSQNKIYITNIVCVIFFPKKDHRHEPTFDKMCLKILDERIRERSHDYRLNPSFQVNDTLRMTQNVQLDNIYLFILFLKVTFVIFQAACAKNIQSCQEELLNRDDGRNKNAESDFLEGQVISCLQQIFLKNEKDLYPECKRKNNHQNRELSS